ncbi:MAG: ParA family protein [Gallionellaceae bacterium]|nr:ParA family protein [Gallionellaceae bacterium]MDD5366846.1 ParA family protein [Gallionellaceae bacterium]
MSARVIAVVNQKGGAGKSTLAMLLAGSLADQGRRVLVADADTQNTSLRWASAGEGFPAEVEDVSGEDKLHKHLKKRLDNYDYIVIDTPPAATAPVTASALRIAHLALVPVIPSPPDMWASLRIREAIQAAREDRNPDLLAYIVVNQAQLNTILAREVLALLPEFGIPMLAAQLKSRTAYRQCAALGAGIAALGSRAAMASLEVDALRREVEFLLSV